MNLKGSDHKFSRPTVFSQTESTGKCEYVQNKFFLEIRNILITS
jgi:hypothetical protein